MKRIVTIQDISCVGKCSLTVALPVISAMGVETAILPTAVLSTHTMFQNPTVRDLTDMIRPVSEHWQREQFRFDAIYTGYLGSLEQIELVQEFFGRFSTDETKIVIDPVMADYGKLYAGFDLKFAGKMRELLPYGTLVLPNMTEAAFLTGLPYYETGDARYNEAYVREMLQALAGLGASCPVITGVSFAPGQIGAYGLTEEGYFSHFAPRLPVNYHGTGDIFASTCTGAMMNGWSAADATALAVDFTAECIRVTMEDPDRRSYGVSFETALPWLMDRIKN